MAGACPPALSAAVANAGGLGSCGALLMEPEAIGNWASEVRAASNGPCQIILGVPDPVPQRIVARDAVVASFLGEWFPEVPPGAGDARPPDFVAQCEALLEAVPPVVSFVTGLYRRTSSHCSSHGASLGSPTCRRLRRRWRPRPPELTLSWRRAWKQEAIGGAFSAAFVEACMVGLIALVPAVADAVQILVVATGGLADGRGVAAALALGASAVQVGTGLLRCPEANLARAWSDALATARPEDTALTSAFSGRAGRALATRYARAASGPGAPVPAAYPVQWGLTAGMRLAGLREGNLDRMQAWSGQAAALAQAAPAAEVAARLWEIARSILR